MTTRNWTASVLAVGVSSLLGSGLVGCGSSAEDPPANTAGSTANAGTSGAGSSAGGSSGGGAAGSSSGAGGSVGGAGGTSGGAAGGGAANGGGGAGGGACTSLMPMGAQHQLIISEVAPGMGIEVYNPGTAAVPVSMIWFCSQFDYQQATATNAKTEVPPGGYVAIDWPEGNGYDLVTGTGGELLLMVNNDGIPTANTTQGYVCWGNHTGGRKDDQTAGVDVLYTGNCAPALTAGSIVRKPSTNGTDAASYDTTVAPSLADCP